MIDGDAILRANPSYELVLADRLEADERALIEGAPGQTDPSDGGELASAYGLLRPVPGSRLEPRIASTDTALLFLTLGQPGPCPGYVRAALGSPFVDALGRLVLDGILQVERDGQFVSGPAAWSESTEPEARNGGRTAELSVEALRYAQALRGLTPETLGLRLYLYGRRPITPALRRRMPDEPAVAAVVVDAAARRELSRHWVEADQPDERSPWRSWHPKPGRRREREADRGPSGTGTACKLYVSPAIDDLPATLSIVAASLADARGVRSFKIGRTLEGIARPDKLVAYFDHQDHLLDAARRLGPALAGSSAHGVPFTAGITGDGMLSWGIDPPEGRAASRGGSWRAWVTQRLAEYLVAATEPGGTAEPWRIALERLRLDGIDVRTWVPSAGAVR